MNTSKITTLILVFIAISAGLIIIDSPNNKTTSSYSQRRDSINQTDEKPINEEPIEIKNLKTANGNNLNYNFSLNTSINEIWFRTWSYLNYNSTKNEIPSFMEQPGTQGYNITYELNITELRDSNTKILISVSDLSEMNLYQYNGTPQDWINLGQIDDDGLGKGSKEGFLRLNKSVQGYFMIFPIWTENINITYNATMKFTVITKTSTKTFFVPDTENTASDYINWQFNYNNFYIPTYILGSYEAIIDWDQNYTLSSVLGREDVYWVPLESSENSTHLIIYGLYEEYNINFLTPNFISVIYNDNLTVSNNELHLYTTCKMAGNLTIEFTDVYGNIYSNKTLVQKNDIVSFNYTMLANSSGGLGFLNITLLNTNSLFFGVKLADIVFHKNTLIGGFSQNTTAFRDFLVLAAYIDTDLKSWWDQKNIAEGLGLTEFERLELSNIPDATVTYEFEGLFGELNVSYVPGLNISIYNSIVDLKEYLVPPGVYNITFKASKPGYKSVEFIDLFNISKSQVYLDLQITPSDKVFTIEETFSVSMNLITFVPYPPYWESFLRVPVFVNLTFINLDTGETDVDVQWLGPDGRPLPIVQSLTISGPMENTTLPGNYNLNFTIVSEYYNGSASVNITVMKKDLDITLNYESKVDEDEGFDITWDLEHGNFTGNRENMTMKIYLDGFLYNEVNFTAMNSSSGGVRFKLDDGDHIITYRLISPFYTAERTIIIEAEKGSSKPKEISWIEENWPFLLLLILAVIAMSIFGVYMTISRRKVKAKRELESELVALKTKYAATEKNVSLIEAQISQIAGIYWILIIHSEQGVTMVEIADFMFDKVLSKEYQQLAEEGVIRDSALIGGFLTAIRNFSRETSDISEHQAIFNSQTDYSTVVNDKEVHRRILEGSNYFMAFISAKETTEIMDVLGAINSIFNDDYGEAVKSFLGRISVFDPFKIESVAYLHNMIIEMQKKLEDEKLMLEHYQRHLKQVQDKIGIKKNK